MDATTAFLNQAAEPLRHRLKKVLTGDPRKPVTFEHVAEAAQPFLAALIARSCWEAGRRVWVVCPTPRAQERLHAELITWLPAAMLLPDVEVAAVEGAVADPEVSAERLSVLERLRLNDAPAAIVVHEQTFGQPAPSAHQLEEQTQRIQVGDTVDREQFTRALLEAGYQSSSQVTERGQLGVRGGILDVFSWQHPLPVRLEFFDDQVESIREFDPHQQTSVRSLEVCTVLLGEVGAREVSVQDHVGAADLLIAAGNDYSGAHVRILLGAAGKGAEDFTEAFVDLDLDAFRGASDQQPLRELRQAKVHEQLRIWEQERYTLAILCRHEREKGALEALARDFTFLKENLCLLFGELVAGFTFPVAKIAVSNTWELLGYAPEAGWALRNRSGKRDVLAASRVPIDFDGLAEGDLMVHLEHGICRYAGLHASIVAEETGADEMQDALILEFAEGARLYVPLEQSYLISRYVGIGKKNVTLNHLGDSRWSSAKKAAERAVFDYAAKMIKLQAIREARQGFAFGPDTPWQRDFENTFPYAETPDQVRSIAAVKEDMESSRPMDRLICGDVGFGKTEVAVRAAFKAMMAGRQVAMLVPTTVLAQQHYDNFSARMTNFPVRIELLSRFRSAGQQREATQGLRDGSVDMVVGTHRLISKDVEFKDLGLLIVDEEQRFGVRHKEQIKERFPTVDILTLSATPIPRTLYLALTGARDLSTLETPPANRHPVETVICPYDERIIRDAIRRELDRQGQIYFLHNRVETIERVRRRLGELCPKARIELGHGQMEEHQLEDIMHRFVSGQTDVLVATTIIESGLDIPNANTIIIDRADRFGLADLYQLRGRVGRGQHKAYAYLMLPRDFISAGEARKRINAIKQYSSLGAGFKIALRDLEIRGAGNILGMAQSGHITAVGFDLYCQLLRQAVAQLKGEKVQPRVEVTLRLDFVAASEAEFLQRNPSGGSNGEGAAAGVLPAFLPVDYIQEPQLRIQAYRLLAGITGLSQLRDLRAGWRDRFGPLPPAAEHLLRLTELKLAASAQHVSQVETKDGKLMMTRAGDYLMIGGKFPRLTSPEPENRMREIFSLLRRFGR